MSKYGHTVYAIGDLDDEDESAGFDGASLDDFDPDFEYPGMGHADTDNEGGESGQTGGASRGDGVPNVSPAPEPGTPHGLTGPSLGLGLGGGSKPATTGAGEEGGHEGGVVDVIHEEPGTAKDIIKPQPGPGPRTLTKKSGFPWGPVIVGTLAVGGAVGVGVWLYKRGKKR